VNAASGIRIEQVVGSLPPALTPLAAQARSEGFRHLDRLIADWEAGALRFDRPGEVLLAAYTGPDLVGVGGLTVEDSLPDAFRVRRVYVGPACRHRGVGRLLVETLLRRVPTVAVTLNAGNTDAASFWEKLGFARHPGDGFTHIRSSPRGRS
jgi:GNAT superfamily N-acetyltransferase